MPVFLTPEETGEPLAFQTPVRPPGELIPLIEAAQVYPALERLALEAKESLWLAFRVFDPDTGLRASESREAGHETWSDLLAARLRAGLQIRVLLSDFDAIVATELHEGTWRTVRRLTEMAAALEPEAAARLQIVAVPHERRMGTFWRGFFWLPGMGKLNGHRGQLNRLDDAARPVRFRDQPGLWRYLRLRRDGLVAWRMPKLLHFYPATHHHKIAVADGATDAATAIIGGLDVDERRYDDRRHERPADETWHDVSLRVRGPVVADISRHIAASWNRDRKRSRELRLGAAKDVPEVFDIGPVPDPLPDAPVEAATLPGDAGTGIQLVRTAAINLTGHPFRLGPKTVERGLERAYLQLIGAARRLLYFETQFFRSKTLAEALAVQAAREPDLQLIMLMPMAPNDVAFEDNRGLDARFGEKLQAECTRMVTEAFGTRCALVSPVQRHRSASDGRDAAYGSGIIYVHAKIGLADDEAGLVSSANMNGRSLAWDTEAGLLWRDPDSVRALRHRLATAWLGENVPQAALDPATAAPAWLRLARRNAATVPAQRTGFIVPYDIGEAEEFGTAAPGTPEELV